MFKSRKHIDKQDGFSVVQAMLALGISSLVSLTALKMMEDSNSLQQTVTSYAGKLNLGQDLQHILAESTTCSNKIKVLNNQPINPSVGKARMTVTLNGVEIGGKNDNSKATYGLKGVELWLGNITYVSDIAGSSGGKLYTGVLSFKSEMKNPGFGGKVLKDEVVGSMLFELDGGLKFARCYSELSLEGSCLRMGGNYMQSRSPACVVPPACPVGQILISEGPGKVGTCQNPPVRVEYVTQYVYVDSGGSSSHTSSNGVLPGATQNPSTAGGAAAGSASVNCDANPQICEAYASIGRNADKIDAEGAAYWQAQLDSGKSVDTIKAEMNAYVKSVDQQLSSVGAPSSQELLNGSLSDQMKYYQEIKPSSGK